jgi:hypothetical protein
VVKDLRGDPHIFISHTRTTAVTTYCTKVSVSGKGRDLRAIFDPIFCRIDVMYLQ